MADAMLKERVKKMTPLQIKMMLHFYAELEPYAGPELNSLEWNQSLNSLLEWQLITPTNQVTDRGKAYVEILMDVKLPKKRCVWLGPCGDPLRETKYDPPC